MKEWLLSDDAKNKVGRPKLADNSILNKAKISICVCFLICIVLSISFVGVIRDESPLKLLYSVTFEKVFGTIENKNGFLVNEYYKDNDYVMEVKPSSNVESYQGNYKYTLYKLADNQWVEEENKTIKKGTKSFKINIKSACNKNVTWKIKLQITNGSKIQKSFAPASWQFVDSEDQYSKYAYKVFTVKGYYSPIPNDELKIAKKNNNKITINTKKNNPRTFIINTPIKVKLKVSYTDLNKTIKLKSIEITDKGKITIPNLSKISNVTFKIYADDVDRYKLDNWSLSENKTHITNTYLLKPEAAYKNN